MSVLMVRCSLCPSHPMPWSVLVFHATPVRSTPWATVRLCALLPLATLHVMSTLAAKAVSKSGTSANLAARALYPNWTVWWGLMLIHISLNNFLRFIIFVQLLVYSDKRIFILFWSESFLNLSLTPLPWTGIDLLCPLCLRIGITTSAPVSCCLMVAHWLLEERLAHWPSGIWPLRHLASRLSSPLQPQHATLWPSAPMPKSASPAAVMEILLFGTCTTRLLLGWKITLNHIV